MRPKPKIDQNLSEKIRKDSDFSTIVQMRSPDFAERNPALPRGVDAAPDFAPLHPGYARQRTLSYFQFLEFDVMLVHGRHRQGVD
jgi:hypothetical protein